MDALVTPDELDLTPDDESDNIVDTFLSWLWSAL
jgi:hypothetical protein